MRNKTLYSLFALVLLAGMVFSLVQPASAMVKPAAQGLDKVEPAVLNTISAKGASDYVVEMAEKADLSAAYEIEDWTERGWFVYDTLKETAARTQQPVIELLKAGGVSYQSFFAGNEIAVTGGDLNSLSAIAALPGVSHIRYPRTATIEPMTFKAADIAVPEPEAFDWGITDTHAPDFWSTFGFQGDGIVVANVDTGVQWDHPALDQSFKCGTDPSDPACWADPSNTCGGSACDNNGHGTHTMGSMVGDDDPSLTYQVGMAPNAQWIACKGCESSSCSDTSLNACADWIVAPDGDPANRPNVVNNSWGGGSGDDWYLAKVNAWRAAGIFPAFSAGNNYSCNSLGSPGDYQESFATASHTSSRTISDFSSKGPSAFGDDPYTKPNISAPGDGICSTVPGSGWNCGYSGTSMASPHTAGAVALLWSCNPSLIGDMATTFELLQDTADTPPPGSCGAPADGEGNYTFGYGYLNVLTAGNQVCSSGSLAGFVYDATSMAPVEGATVTADNGGGIVVDTTTLADGSYLMNLPDGTYDVSATKYGYTTDLVTGIVIVEGGLVTQHFYIDLLGMTTVSGYVTDGGVEGLGLHGYPLYSSIHITATGFDETLYVDPFTGYYEIELVEETDHTFVTTAVPSGYDVLTETVTPTGATYAHDIELMADGEACAAPGYQPDYDIFYSFEGSDEGFTPGGTTSFAWGDFTSGPGEGHSGTKGIATNPAGNYNANELGWMASPVIDLTGFGTSTPVIQWYDWKDIESVSWDWARVDVTKDGGVTWFTVWGPVGGVTDTAYEQQTVVLDPTYNVANFQFRFYFKSDSSVQYEGWYVDDIGIIAAPVPPPTTVWSSNFDTDNGGFTVSGTTSFAWGAPTSGPGAPYSAPNVWATNLAGNYNSSESGWITSPVIDLSAHAGLAPTISFWHWNDIESTSFDWGAVEVTRDGGTTWTDVSGKIGDVSPWSPKSIQLDPTYAVSNFQFRFYFRSDSSVNYAGWYIDDVAVSVAEEVVVAAPCVVVPGGVVAGYVFDDNTEEVLVGAGVVSPTAETMTFELEGDPDNAGIYWVFQPTTDDPEDVVFTASMDKYMDDTQTVSVAADAITQQDFYLGAGWLEFDPESLEVTMMMGDAPLTETLTISNLGDADAIIEISEKDEGYLPPLHIPAFTGTLPEDTRPVSMGPAPDAKPMPLSAAGALRNLLAGEPATAIDIYPGENLVHIPDTTVPGYWDIVGSVGGTQFFAGDFTGGDFSTLYVADYGNNNLYAVDTATAVYTLIGPTTPPAGQTFSGLTGTPDGMLYGLTTSCSTSNLVTVDPETRATTNLGALSGVGCGIDLAYNTDDDMIYIVDILTDSLYKVDPATMTTTLVGSLGVGANYAQGMDYEEETGILYWAAYTTQGELRVIDMTTGASALVGAFPSGAETDCLAFETGGGADVPWLSEDPVSGTVPAMSDLVVDVTFDPTGAGLGQPGDYLAELKVKHDTPYAYANIPVTLHLLAPADYGTFNGTVTGLEACDVNPMPLEGATVNFWQGGSILYTTTTLANGYYGYSLPEGTYDIEVLMDGYVSMIAFDMPVAGGETVTVDFELRLDAPCLSVDPTSLEQWLMPDTTGDQTLTLVNSGAGEAVFEIVEMAVAGILWDVEMVVDDGTAENSIGLSAGGQFIWLNRFTPDPDAFPFTVDEVQVIFNTTVGATDQFQVVIYSDTDGDGDPGTGAVYLGGETFTVQYNDMLTFNVFTLTEPVQVEGPGDVLIGLVNRSGASGYSDYPAAIDQSASQQRSWIGTYAAGNPPAEPPLPADSLWGRIDDFGFAGNWTLRAYGSSAAGDIVWLSEDPISGTVAGDSELDVTVTFDATGLALGDYFATLRVKNPPAAAINVPVTLHVVETITRQIWLPIIMR